MEVLRVAIMDYCRRKKGKPFCPSEVVRQMFPEDWELFMEDIHNEMVFLFQEELIHVTQDGKPIDLKGNPTGPFKIVGRVKPK